MPREFKVANCWEGRRIRLKMYLIEQKFAIYYHKSNKKKMQTNAGDGKCKLWLLLHFIGKNKRKKSFSKS